jgi:hypothetical protein
VLGADPSSILGSLSANGKVFLVNPNGILFGKGASVNVGGLVASTLNITDSDFFAGNYKFSGASQGSVQNLGSISAAGGYVALLGANVSNDGVISAQLGTVALAAGNAITLDVAGDGLLNVTVSQGALNALVQNGGLIQADGGQVLLSAQAADILMSSAVNNTGVIQAQTLVNRNGKISLLAYMQGGTVAVGGTLDASAPNGGDGGFIETSAAHVNIARGAKITTEAARGTVGTWLIDPTNFTIGSVAGDNIAGVTLSALLVTNSVVIDTATGVDATNAGATPPVTGLTTNTAIAGAGDIFVNDAVTWTPTPNPTTLTLRAARDVNLNAAITATGGNLVACCGRDIKVNASVTTTDGGVSLKAGRDLVIGAAMTTTRGNVVLSAGSDGSGLGVVGVGGTVVFGPGVLYTVTAPGTAITVDYTPTLYATPHDYSGNFTGTAKSQLTQHMLVFVKGNDKVYDGNTTATLSFTGDPTAGGINDVTLGTGTATFADKNVAPNIAITYSGYTLGGAAAANFALWQSCLNPAVGTTNAAITPRPVTIKADDATKVYGEIFTPANTAFTLPVPPLPGEIVTNVNESTPGTPATEPVATYLITPSNAAGASFNPANYTITYQTGNLVVTPATLTVSANNNTKVYGQTFTPAGTAFTTSALQNGETVGSVTETSPAGTPTTAAVPGTYAITPSAATGGTFAPGNYSINYVNGALTVTPAPLTVTANDSTKTFGQIPALTGFTTTPLANGETIGSVTETSPGSVATASVAGSPYAITPSVATGGTFTPGNYTIAYNNGVLTITPAISPPITNPPIVVPQIENVPTVAPPVWPETWVPVVTPPTTPPELLTLVAPVRPAPVVLSVPVVPIAPPTPLPVFVPTPIVTPVAPPPALYVAPVHPRKQDRN